MASTSHDFVAGEVLTASRMDNLPQGNLGAATPITSNVGPTSGTTPLDIITAPAVTIAATGRRLQITFHCRGISASATAETFVVKIQEGSTVLASTHHVTHTTGVDGNGAVCIAYVDSPTVASHTYKATITRAIGAGTATVSGAANEPITLEVEDIGLA